MKKSSTQRKENKSSKMDKNHTTPQEQQHTTTSKSTSIKQRTARIRPEPTRYLHDLVKGADNRASEKPNEESEIFKSVYTNNLSTEPEHIGTVYARINECNSEENEGEELCDNSTEDITNTTKDTTNGTNNELSGDNKNSGDNSGNSGDNSNSGENNPVFNYKNENYKFDQNWIRKQRKIEDEARYRSQNLENRDNDNNKPKNKDQNSSDKNSNSKQGSNGSKNTKLYKMHIEKPDKHSENSNRKNDKNGTSGYKTNSKTNSGSKVNSEQKNSNGKTVNSGPTTGSIEKKSRNSPKTEEFIYDEKSDSYKEPSKQKIEINCGSVSRKTSQQGSKQNSKNSKKSDSNNSGILPNSKKQPQQKKIEEDHNYEDKSSSISPKIDGEITKKEILTLGQKPIISLRPKVPSPENLPTKTSSKSSKNSKGQQNNNNKFKTSPATSSSADPNNQDNKPKLKKTTSLQSVIVSSSNKKSNITTSTDFASEINYIYGVLQAKCLTNDVDKNKTQDQNKGTGADGLTRSESFTFGATARPSRSRPNPVKRVHGNTQETSSSGSGNGIVTRNGNNDEIGFGEKSYRKNSKVGKVKNENSKKTRKVNLFRGRLETKAFAKNWSGSEIRNDGERPRNYRKIL